MWHKHIQATNVLPYFFHCFTHYNSRAGTVYSTTLMPEPAANTADGLAYKISLQAASWSLKPFCESVACAVCTKYYLAKKAVMHEDFSQASPVAVYINSITASLKHPLFTCSQSLSVLQRPRLFLKKNKPHT